MREVCSSVGSGGYYCCMLAATAHLAVVGSDPFYLLALVVALVVLAVDAARSLRCMEVEDLVVLEGGVGSSATR